LVVPRSKSIGPDKFKMIAKPEIGLLVFIDCIYFYNVFGNGCY